MLSRLSLNKVLGCLLILIIGVGLGWLSLPVWRQILMQYHQTDYGTLVEKCDVAMRDHLQAKQGVEKSNSEENESHLYSAEVGLLVCQDYDLYQKNLMQWGLRENELAKMRLLAIEAQSSDLEEVVSTHEIRF
jgi:hypothetical protein|tara:strand:+ start:25051 stop:25449 length:399 start_codon:yes stop_codon:yes gene_type:complete